VTRTGESCPARRPISNPEVGGRDTCERHEEFLTRLAKESAIETPTREQVAKLDRKRRKKGSNDDWTHPHDPAARITKMKDGGTHLAHQAEHAVDLELSKQQARPGRLSPSRCTVPMQETPRRFRRL
jgi:hypothetical protein